MISMRSNKKIWWTLVY